MRATNFDPSMLPELSEVLSFSIQSPRSSFYRDFYGSAQVPSVKTYDDFTAIPLLQKKDLLAVAINDRTFVPQEEIKYFAFSGGTTDKKHPTIVPHSSFYPEVTDGHLFNKELLRSLGVERALLLLSPMAPAFIRLMSLSDHPAIVTAGDISNLPLMAMITTNLRIHALVTTATILDHFIPELKQAQFDFSLIKYISLGSEYCSSAKYTYLKQMFPNATFRFRFGTSEIGRLRGYKCDHLNTLAPSVFHPYQGTLVEIVDDSGMALPMGEVGEIIHTDLYTKAFPIIRYRTRDMATLEHHTCSCGNPFIMTLSGRANFDVLKFSGITLHTEAISSAVHAAHAFVEPVFQMHVFEQAVGNSVKPLLRLDLKLKPEHARDIMDESFKELVREKISAGLRVSAQSTLKQLVDRNIFLPMEIVFTDQLPQAEAKSKNIISHLE